MRLPRDISGREVARALSALGYQASRQSGSHMRLTTSREGEHHITIPQHGVLRIGTLSSILAAVADHFGLTREQVAETLFGRGG